MLLKVLKSLFHPKGWDLWRIEAQAIRLNKLMCELVQEAEDEKYNDFQAAEKLYERANELRLQVLSRVDCMEWCKWAVPGNLKDVPTEPFVLLPLPPPYMTLDTVFKWGIMRIKGMVVLLGFALGFGAATAAGWTMEVIKWLF